MKTLTVGTRGSLLAVEQARPMVDFIQSQGIRVVWREFTTHGDQWLAGPLEKAGATGLFTKELEDALLLGEVDLLIHSLKDVSLERPQGIVTACIPKRANPLDLMILRPDAPPALRLGTSSIRREKLLQERFPQATFTWIRGNVPTRIQRVREGVLREEPLHGTFLAAAGIERLQAISAPGLDLSDLIVKPLDPSQLPPAPGQGALLAETRQDSAEILALLAPYHHPDTARCVSLERAVLASIGGGCQQPLGAFATLSLDGLFHLRAAFAHTRGILRWEQEGHEDNLLLQACQQALCSLNG